MKDQELEKLVVKLNLLLDGNISPHSASLAFDEMAMQAKGMEVTIKAIKLLPTYRDSQLQSLSDLKIELQEKGDYAAAAGVQQSMRKVQQQLGNKDTEPTYQPSEFIIQDGNIVLGINPRDPNGSLLLELTIAYFGEE
jgi:hypothetical protein